MDTKSRRGEAKGRGIKSRPHVMERGKPTKAIAPLPPTRKVIKMNFESLPEIVKNGSARLCVWRYETRDGKQTKVPYSPRDLYAMNRASSNNPETFADWQATREYFNAYQFDGIGIGLFGNLAGIDIDHCIDEHGEISALARHIVATMDSYTEVSPSGSGLHILFTVTDDLASYLREHYRSLYFFKNSPKAPDVEVYISGVTNRYLTLTGSPISIDGHGTTEVQERSMQVQAILDELMRKPVVNQATPSQPVEADDAQIIELAMAARNGASFSRLWSGDVSGHGSHSEADLALCNHLAFWTGKDADRIDRLFRQSGLMRDKWEREDYREWTIAKAIEGCTDTYTPPRTRGEEGTHGVPSPAKTSVDAFEDFLQRIRTRDYEPYRTGIDAFDKLLGGGVTRQSLVVITAAPGAGKTALAQDVAEAMAADGQDVIYLNLEMSREYMYARSLSRILARYNQVMSATDILRGYQWNDKQAALVEQAANSYRNTIASHIRYNPDDCGSGLEDISAMLERYGKAAKAEGKMAPPIVLDYLHLVTSNQRIDSTEIVKQAVSTLKEYAVRYDTFVIAIAATNRAANMSGKQTQSSARDSSAIEYTADVQIGLNFAAFADGLTKEVDGKRRKYSPENPDDMDELLQQNPRKMVVQVLKNRMNQPGGKLHLDFFAGQSLFKPTNY